jgi:hypothetical protein
MSSRFGEYLREFDSYPKMVIYNFMLTHGGISDCIKFFMLFLEYCIDRKIRLYYIRNNILIEKYVFVKHEKMVLSKKQILRPMIQIHKHEDMHRISDVPGACYIVYPMTFYSTFSFEKLRVPFSEVFAFSHAVIANSRRIFPETFLRIFPEALLSILPEDLPKDAKSYVSVHLRLGDKFLETDKSYVKCKEDKRPFDLVESIYEINRLIFMGESVVLFCDNQKYKHSIMKKCPGLMITAAEIGHTSLVNTTDQQVMDAVSEFYIMTRSSKIVALSYSGFSLAAAKFNRVPIECIYEQAESSSETICGMGI